MLVKAVLLFLVVIAAIGWVGRLLTRRGGGLLGSGRRPPELPRARPCRACGRPRVGRGPCPCGRA